MQSVWIDSEAIQVAVNVQNHELTLLVIIELLADDKLYISICMMNLSSDLRNLRESISGWIFEKVIDSYKPSVPSTPLPNFPVPSSYKNRNCLNIRTSLDILDNIHPRK